MGARKPFEQWEIDFITAEYPQMGATALARKLNRTRNGVDGLIKRLGLREIANKRTNERDLAEMDETADPDESLVRLKELRDIQHRALMSADPRNIPALSAEYRATLEEIREIEDGDKRAESNPLSQIIESINVNLR